MEIGENNLSSSYSIDFWEPENSVLSICASNHGFSCGLFDIHSLIGIGFFTFPDIESLLKVFKPEFHFAKVVVTQLGGFYSLIPLNLEESTLNILTNFHETNDSDQLNKLVSGLDGSLVFRPLDSFKELVNLFPSSIAGHAAAYNIESAIIRNRYKKGIRIYAHLNFQHLELMVFSGSKLLSVNSEKYLSFTDVLYHISARIDEYKFNQLEDVLFLSGTISAEDTLFIELKKVVKDIRLNTGFKYQKTAKELGIVPKHQFLQSINSFQCA